MRKASSSRSRSRDRRSCPSRGGRAGSDRFGLFQKLARVHDAVGIERLLDPPHQVELKGGFVARQVVDFEAANAMLGTDRAAHTDGDIMHGAAHFRPARKSGV